MAKTGEPVDLRWERGTIVIGREAPVRDLPGVLWDPRIGAFRAPGHTHRTLVTSIRKRGFAVEDRVLTLGEPPAPFEPPELRAYQECALAAWEMGGRRGIVCLPTGAGKTRVAVAAVAKTQARTLVLVPTRVLLEQWARTLRAAGVTPGVYGDGQRDAKPITVATFASALRHVDTLGNRFELLVIDEVHHFGSPAGDETLEMTTAPWRLGLTATPPDGARAERLDVLVGPIVFRSSIGDLAGRFLAPFHVVTVTVGLTASERATYDAQLAAYQPVVRRFFDAAPGATWPDFVRAAGKTVEGQRGLAAWRRSRTCLAFTAAKRAALGQLLARHRASRVLVFAQDVATAYAVSREHLVPALTSEIARDERAAWLAHFAAGELRVLVSARVLNEGVDVPAADVAILVGGSQGAREYVQRVGRVLRPSAGKEAVVYEMITGGTHESRQAEGRRGALAAG
jgi:superfamily II DNA or RNA helicase